MDGRFQAFGTHGAENGQTINRRQHYIKDDGVVVSRQGRSQAFIAISMLVGSETFWLKAREH